MFWALQELVGPGRPRRRHRAELPVDGERHARARAPTVSGLALDPERGWALDLDALDVAAAARARGSSRSTSPTTRPARCPTAATFGRARRAVRRARHPALLRRGLPRARAASRTRTLAAGRRPVAAPRCRWASCPRPTGCPGCASAGSPAATARCSRGWRRASTTRRSATPAPSELIAAAALRRGAQIRARNRAIIDANLPRLRRVLRRAGASCSRGSRRRPAASASRATSARTASRRSAATLVEQAGVVLLPAVHLRAPRSAPCRPTASASASAARHPEPALAAFESLPRVRERPPAGASLRRRALGPRPLRQLRAHAARDGRAVRRRLRRRPGGRARAARSRPRSTSTTRPTRRARSCAPSSPASAPPRSSSRSAGAS